MIYDVRVHLINYFRHYKIAFLVLCSIRSPHAHRQHVEAEYHHDDHRDYVLLDAGHGYDGGRLASQLRLRQ